MMPSMQDGLEEGGKFDRSKHTAGPWEYRPSGGKVLPRIVGAGRVLAIFKNEPMPANANLIAAAPDLLGALDYQVKNCPVCRGTGVDREPLFDILQGREPVPEDCDRCASSRKAIAKARGEV